MTETIPEGWERKPLSDTEYFKVLSSGINEFQGEKHYLSTSSISCNRITEIEEEITYTKRPSRANMQPIENSVWFARMKATLKVLNSNKNISKDYILSTGFCGIKCLSKINKGYLEQVFLSPSFNKRKDLFSTGSTQQGITNESLPMLLINIPPVKEQEKIAEILSKTDKQIQLTEEIITKTEELKKGMMQELLTNGIGHTEFKETAIGKIPSNWSIKKLSEITTKIGDGLHSTPKYVDISEYYFINGNNLVDGKIKIFDKTKCVNKEEYEKHFIELNKNTILLSINGTIGNTAYYNGEKVILGKSSAYINCNNSVNRDFISLALQSLRVSKYFMAELTGTTIKNLSLKTIRNAKLEIPALEEQNKIASIMTSIIQDIKNNELELKRLKKVKRGLMQDLLTGKVRVKV
jgi:type I restriction enzyme, S subunit